MGGKSKKKYYGSRMFASIEDREKVKKLLERFETVGIDLPTSIEFIKRPRWFCRYSSRLKIKSGVLYFRIPSRVIMKYRCMMNEKPKSSDIWLMKINNNYLSIVRISKYSKGFAFAFGEKKAKMYRIEKSCESNFQLIKIAKHEEIAKKIIEEYKNGVDIKALEQKYPLGYWTIQKLLKKGGIKLRTLSEQKTIMHHGRLPDIKGLSENKLKIIFAILGDNAGSVKSNRHIIGIHAGIDLNFARAFADIFEKEYKIRPPVYKRNDKEFLVILENKEIFDNLKRFAQFGAYEWKLYNNTVEYIERMDKNELGHAVSYFWEAEGYPCTRNKVIKVTSVNKEGLKQIQKIMCELGIKTSLSKPTFAGHPRGLYTLKVSRRENIELFRKLVNFVTIRKSATVEKILDSYKRIIKVHSYKEYNKAFELKQKGLLTKQISDKLNVPIRTLQGWFYDGIRPRS